MVCDRSSFYVNSVKLKKRFESVFDLLQIPDEWSDFDEFHIAYGMGWILFLTYNLLIRNFKMSYNISKILLVCEILDCMNHKITLTFLMENNSIYWEKRQNVSAFKNHWFRQHIFVNVTYKKEMGKCVMFGICLAFSIHTYLHQNGGSAWGVDTAPSWVRYNLVKKYCLFWSTTVKYIIYKPWL